MMVDLKRWAVLNRWSLLAVTVMLLLAVLFYVVPRAATNGAECAAALLHTTPLNIGQVEGAWVFAPHPPGTAVIVYPDTALWHGDALWVRARPVDGEYETWVEAWDGEAWRLALEERACWRP